MILIVPVATGNNEAHFPGHPGLDIDPDICLQRTYPEAFRVALLEMGQEQGDAERLTIQCGRSWSVYRRVKNNNPAQKRPMWVTDKKYAPVLRTIALIGAYEEKNKADQESVEHISGISIDQFSSLATEIMQTGDAPIVRIDSIIKSKSPLEIFKMNEYSISVDMFRRFIMVCEGVLGQLDPTFYLPQEDRWLANVKGKVRPQSDAFLQGIAGALPRISVLCVEENWCWQISQLVKKLTYKIDGVHWLAISGILQQLAEAAPDAFLESLEDDLRLESPQIYSLFKETSSSALGGACLYADLLWALELLAWAPNRLLRVSRILAELENAPKKGNWGNSPQESLLNIYRGWIPQTSASVGMRNRAVSKLAKTHPKETFYLLMGILHLGHDVAAPSPRPKWRDDDAGVAKSATKEEYAEAISYAAKVSFELAEKSVDNAIELFKKYDIFDDIYRKQILNVMDNLLKCATVENTRIIRRELRHKLHYEFNYRNSEHNKGLEEEELTKIQQIYNDSEPVDTIEKYQWLFEHDYCEIPEKSSSPMSQEEREHIKHLRVNAIQEIFNAYGFHGIETLGEASGKDNCIGYYLNDLCIDKDALARWAAEEITKDVVPNYVIIWLQSLNNNELAVIVQKTLMIGSKELEWNDRTILKFLKVIPSRIEVWDIVSEYSPSLQNSYWKNITRLPFTLDIEDKKQGIHKLLENGNPAAALRSLLYCAAEFSGSEIANILERNFNTPANALADLNIQLIGDYVKIMEKSADLDRPRLLRLEFQMALSFGQFVAELMVELQRELVEQPKDMVAVISNAYKPDAGQECEPDKQKEHYIKACSNILFYTHITPGLQRDGTFSEAVFQKYVSELLKLAVDEGYLKGTQLVLGKLMAYAPETENGSWPPVCVCEVLDDPQYDIMRNEFVVAVKNKRGTTVRSPYDGGVQERALAAKYKNFADQCQIEFPFASKALADIADSYQHDALREDRAAENLKERY